MDPQFKTVWLGIIRFTNEKARVQIRKVAAIIYLQLVIIKYQSIDD